MRTSGLRVSYRKGHQILQRLLREPRQATIFHLSRCTRRFAGGALGMTALAGERWLLAEALAIVAAVFGVLCGRTRAARMCALVNLFLSHDTLLAPRSISIVAHTWLTVPRPAL